MKSLIIYCSDYKKNTEVIARILADKIDSELINIRDVSDLDIESWFWSIQGEFLTKAF